MAICADILHEGARELSGVTETPRLDAEILLAHALEMPRPKLLASMRDRVDGAAFRKLLARRSGGEPLAYILGEWEFFSRSFFVEPPVLVPRPETEHLVEAVIEHVGNGDARVLELGTGTGCVAISVACECSRSRSVATDIQAPNLDLARRNARRHGVADRIEFREGDLFDAVPSEKFEVICSNPPYIAETEREELSATVRDFEDPVALFGGADGLDLIEQIVAGAGSHLEPGGLLAMEIGAGQEEAVRALLLDGGYARPRFLPDLAGIARIAVATRDMT